MPFPGTPRSSFGHVVLGDQVIIAGGHLGMYHQYPETAFSCEVHSVDIATGTKATPLRDLAPRQGHRLVTYQGDVYSFGGFQYDRQLDFSHDPRPDEMFAWYARSTDEVYRYTVAKDAWELVTALPRRRSSYVVGQDGNLVFLVGGWDGTPAYRNDYTGRLHIACEVFDLSKLQVLPNDLRMPAPLRRAFTAATLGSKLYVAGGTGVITEDHPEGEQFDEFSAFDFKESDPNKRWQTSYYGQLPRLPKRLFSPGMGVVDGSLVLVGGAEPNHRKNLDVWLWKPGQPAWVKNSIGLNIGATFPEIVDAGGRRALVFGGHAGKDPAALWEYLPIDAL